MHAIDTNVLVRLIVRDDDRQVTSAEMFIEIGAWVSILALAETTWVLTSIYEFDARSLTKTIKMLLAHRILVLQERETVKMALDLFRAKPSLGFTDCMMHVLAQRAGHLPLGTFDRSLAKVDGTQKL